MELAAATVQMFKRDTYHESGYLASRDVEAKVVQHNGVRSCGVRKGNVFNLDFANSVSWLFTRLVKRVNLGISVDEGKHLLCCGCRASELNRIRSEGGQTNGSDDDGKENTVKCQ